MFNALVFAALLPLLSVNVLADPVPDAPSPGQVFNEGTQCHIEWAPDTTGKWKTMNIELMTGQNLAMVHLTTVATVDGTDATKTSFDYPCPSVTPNSAIYFYQFSSPNSPNLTWTGRFAIADAEGNTTPEPNQTQPNGDPIPWGLGALTDPSSAKPAPSYLNGGSTTSGTGSTSSAAGTPTPSPSSTSTSSSASFTTVLTSIPPASSSSSSSSNSTGSLNPSASPTNSTNAASMLALDFRTRATQALAGLMGTAVVFVALF